MLRFITSLSFLYLITIVLLLIYGWFYYKNFSRTRVYSNKFPWVFTAIALACFGFLFVNLHPPLSLRTFSNVDHHFIRHDGFLVKGNVELGRTDTVNFHSSAYNSFHLKKSGNVLTVNSTYSEDPLYSSSPDGFKIISTSFPAASHTVSVKFPGAIVTVETTADSSFRLMVNDSLVCTSRRQIQKASSFWNLFREQVEFINTPWYTNSTMVTALQQLYILRNNVSSEKGGELKYFISGKIFRYIEHIFYDDKNIEPAQLAFESPVQDKSTLAWGIGFFDNNKNQFIVQFLQADSFQLTNKYPVSYPLAEENKNDWSEHRINKFLVSDPAHLSAIPAVFKEGFMFPAFNGDNSLDFNPVLLTYEKSRGGHDPGLHATFMDGSSSSTAIRNGKLLLPAANPSLNWLFSIHNTFDWNFGAETFKHGTWNGLIFGTLGFFFLIVLLTALTKTASNHSWIWQLLSSISLVLLTTRFFLYWRYKTFPPFEGLDLPSVQQLNSIGNFAVIIGVAILLAVVFGFGFLRLSLEHTRKLFFRLINRQYHPTNRNNEFVKEDQAEKLLNNSVLVKKTGKTLAYFLSWILLLAGSGFYAAMNDFEPSTCRHLALLLIFFYFFYLYLSYKFSPLVTASGKSWWSIRTGGTIQLVINNPVKVLLSVSLLAVFAFIDIGFAIIFLNFLLFNEAFLCINYAIAGLSAGSRKNSFLFGLLGAFFLSLFVLNLLYGPYIFNVLLGLPKVFYTAGYVLFALLIAYLVTRLMHRQKRNVRTWSGVATAAMVFMIAFLFFPRQKILDKAAITKYRIDVMTMPVDKAIEIAYEDGKTYEPVIRAAQNQWFINTFIFEKNNPLVQKTGFTLLPHAPQTKGAKYNAQATDLVASRFLIAEHGKWSVLLYVLLLLLPSVLLASFYKLYPDFTNRVNNQYPAVTTGFSLLNYLLITALLVILAATGRYIFFGQDLPFGSILSKQSILFPVLIIISAIYLFRNIPLEQYPNRKKMFPGFLVFGILAFLLFFVQPLFNKDKKFEAPGLAKEMDSVIETRLQPIYDFIDTASTTRKLTFAVKDRLFTDTLKQLLNAGYFNEEGKFFRHELAAYAKTDFSRHLDQRKLIYLDLYAGRPQLAVNDNFFHLDPPPHLRESWTGNIYSDTTNWNISFWNSEHKLITTRMSGYTNEPSIELSNDFKLVFSRKLGENMFDQLALVKKSSGKQLVTIGNKMVSLTTDTLLLQNPSRLRISDERGNEQLLVVEPDAFMKNYYVNGNRFYVYPMAEDFIWARNFAENVSAEYTGKGMSAKHAFISLDALLTDSLTERIRSMMLTDTAYKNGAEYGICIADGNGRLVAMADFIKGLDRPDPNDKPGFNNVIRSDQGFISQSLLRKKIGNINLLRMNPGPGSTLKPVVFSAIASQLNLDWDLFAAEGFTKKQQYFGGEKVAEYDFEKNNGRIGSVVDYLRYSDNYYHSNLLLLGSYSKQSLQDLLSTHFATNNPEGSFQWPYFSYKGKQYWLNGFRNWPGYMNGKANFGSDSSFVSLGLFNNYGILTDRTTKGADHFPSGYDSLLFMAAARRSGFILPEYALFDQKGTGMDNRKPNEVFMSSFRGHVKGSSQVMIPPVKMLEAFGRLTSQNRAYTLTLNPYARELPFRAFDVDNGVQYSNYLGVIREKVFEGMKQALSNGTAARLGSMLKEEKDYYYYAKTGTTGDDEVKTKSKLFAIVISKKAIHDPGYNFRNNRYYTIYFTSQNGPAKQNEEFQADIIRYIQDSPVFKRYMMGY